MLSSRESTRRMWGNSLGAPHTILSPPRAREGPIVRDGELLRRSLFWVRASYCEDSRVIRFTPSMVLTEMNSLVAARATSAHRRPIGFPHPETLD